MFPGIPGGRTCVSICGGFLQTQSGSKGVYQIDQVATTIKDRGLDALFYLDDWLLKSPSLTETEAVVQVTRETVESMGFDFKQARFSLDPQQCLVWLGML